MKKILTFLIIALGFLSCKNNSDTSKAIKLSEEDLSIEEKIAMAHGLEHFNELEEIKFTFNVKIEDSMRTSRSWHWRPRTDEIRLTEGDISRSYTKDETLAVDEKEIDRKFINDTYWLLFPFQMVWSDAEISGQNLAVAPISETQLYRLLVEYPDEGGYTPGDSYEIFYGDDFLIREWIYKSADGSREMPTTWEDYQDFNGLKIAKSHKSPDGSFELYFTGIEVK